MLCSYHMRTLQKPILRIRHESSANRLYESKPVKIDFVYFFIKTGFSDLKNIDSSYFSKQSRGARYHGFPCYKMEPSILSLLFSRLNERRPSRPFWLLKPVWRLKTILAKLNMFINMFIMFILCNDG